MNPTEERLSEAFQALSEESLQGAPAEIGLSVKTAFRQHHLLRRRQRRLIGVAALGACVVIAAVAVSKSWSAQRREDQSTLAAKGTQEKVLAPEPKPKPLSPERAPQQDTLAPVN